MKHTKRHITHVIRFCRWSRKAFAVFASLGKVVIICRVAKSITEISLSKVSKYTVRRMRHLIQQPVDKIEETVPPDIGNLLAAYSLFVEPATPSVPHELCPNEINNHKMSCSCLVTVARAGHFVSTLI